MSRLLHAGSFHRSIGMAAILAVLLLCASSAAMAFTTDLLPPPEGTYVAAGPVFFANGVILANVAFSQFMGSIVPPAPLITTMHGFGSTLDMDVSMDQGQTWNHETISGPGSMSTKHYQDIGNVQYFAEEMISFTAVGSYSWFMLRESPFLHSYGTTTIEHLQDGTYRIDSFFDVFVELSLDGGQSWTPATQSSHLDLLPEPSGLMSLFCGIGAISGLLLKRRR